jgi:uncharacterized protein (DUF2267 family)
MRRTLGWKDDQKANGALCALLHALEDPGLGTEAGQPGAGVPLEGLGKIRHGRHGRRPARKPLQKRHPDEFLRRLHESFAMDDAADPEEVTRALFRLLCPRSAPSNTECFSPSRPAKARSRRSEKMPTGW